ncbi:NAD(P)/FAD-dependent oxidoreductase [Rubrobacter aplysinae]|uniref:NAD(P)/FAD-dependent oxidoreductase n=1 Tax=Rubrobacter aplysinae TaxID=909625 RepID=UPI00064BB324|nr:FAD-dependent oxidoreductase [Rubrobacter aplysinae]
MTQQARQNQQERVVIVGGGPGGISAARAYRDTGGTGHVTLLAGEQHPPYRRPPLTKEYLRGELERDELPMQPATWFQENGVELRPATPASYLDAGRGVVGVEGGDEIPYDACVLATGSEPIRPPIPGAEDPEVLTMRTVEDSTSLSWLAANGNSVIVVGSGFIGCEAAASLAMRGAEVTVVSLDELPQGALLGEEAGGRIRHWLEEYGVRLRLGAEVEKISRSEKGFEVALGGGEPLASGAVLLGTGARPRLEIAQNAGLTVEPGGILADAAMRTEAPGVYAVGDISYAYNPSAGRRLHVEHWGEALSMGSVAGTVMAGGEARWDTAPGFWSTIGGRTIKYTAWGDGSDEAKFVPHDGSEESFTVWYGREDICVGVLTHNFDKDYEEGRQLVESGAPMPV